MVKLQTNIKLRGFECVQFGTKTDPGDAIIFGVTAGIIRQAGVRPFRWLEPPANQDWLVRAGELPWPPTRELFSCVRCVGRGIQSDSAWIGTLSGIESSRAYEYLPGEDCGGLDPSKHRDLKSGSSGCRNKRRISPTATARQVDDLLMALRSGVLLATRRGAVRCFRPTGSTRSGRSMDR